MAKQFGLGKGLNALIPEPESRIDDAAENSAAGGYKPGEGLVRVPLRSLFPNPDQPRKSFDDASLAELAASLKRNGLIQPILAEPRNDGTYRIVAGERRYRAALLAGLEEAPVILRSLTPAKRLEIALIENIQRENLNPVDEAEAYRSLMDLGSLSQEELADTVGKSRSAVANALRLLRLPEPMLRALRDGGISAGHARALLAVSDAKARDRLFSRITEEGLSVREVEAAAQSSGGSGRGEGRDNGRERGAKSRGIETSKTREPELREVEERLIRAFGTKVSIKGDARQGVVSVEYYSLEDLERILELVSPS